MRSRTDHSSESFHSLRSCFEITCLQFTVSLHPERLFFCLHLEVILIPISDKVALVSFDASIYLASLEGRKWVECFIGVGSWRLRSPVQRIYVLPSVFVLYPGLALQESACRQGCEWLLRDKAYQTVSYAQQVHLEKTRRQRFSPLSAATDHYFTLLQAFDKKHTYLYLKIRRTRSLSGKPAASRGILEYLKVTRSA